MFHGGKIALASPGSAWSNVESQEQLVTNKSPLQCTFKNQWIRVLECDVHLVQDFAECQGPVAVEKPVHILRQWYLAQAQSHTER